MYRDTAADSREIWGFLHISQDTPPGLFTFISKHSPGLFTFIHPQTSEDEKTKPSQTSLDSE
jgi:hypothetical protein